MKRNELHIPEMDGRHFDAQENADGTYRLVSLASDHGPARNGCWWLRRLWNDACDIGIAIRGRTGYVARFYLHHEEIKDGDLLAWHFRPVDEATARRSRTAEVVIFND